MKDNFVALFKHQLGFCWSHTKEYNYEGAGYDVLRCELSKNTWVTVTRFDIPILYTVRFYKKGTEVFSFNIWIFSKLYREISELIKRKKFEKVQKEQEEFFKEFLEG